MAGPNKKDLTERLKKIEGQIKGIQKMLEEDRNCVDVLLQVSAARAGLQKVGLNLLECHVNDCVSDVFQEKRNEASVQELIKILDKFIK